jgi:hypothetical protein
MLSNHLNPVSAPYRSRQNNKYQSALLSDAASGLRRNIRRRIGRQETSAPVCAASLREGFRRLQAIEKCSTIVTAHRRLGPALRRNHTFQCLSDPQRRYQNNPAKHSMVESTQNGGLIQINFLENDDLDHRMVCGVALNETVALPSFAPPHEQPRLGMPELMDRRP